MIFWILGIFWIFGRIGFFYDLLTGPRSAKNFRSRIFDDREMAEKSIFPVGDHFPRPYDANFRGITNNPFRSQRPLGKFIFVLFCCCIRRDEEKETHNINVVGKRQPI